NKNFFAAKEYLEAQDKGDSVAETILQIEELFGSVEVLDKARALSQNPLCKKAIERLSGLYEVLCAYGVQRYVSFDLGMLNSYHYYTGIIFKVYTYGIGDAVVKGGRYDGLLPYFGKNSAAIGFVIVIDDLMQALSRQKIQIKPGQNPITLVYDTPHFPQALETAAKYRQQGQPVQMLIFDPAKSRIDYEEYAARLGNGEVIFFADSQEKSL
ncbi:MAG: ATP phosphoribosyltransferase regulatory subunit, partial [Lachnospiraceae bacterium]